MTNHDDNKHPALPKRAPSVMCHWVRVTDTKPYIEAEDYSDEFGHGLSHRLYRQKGRRYPLLDITFVAFPAGLTLSVSYKSGKGQWWSGSYPNAAVPLELLPDLREMLDEAVILYAKTAKTIE